MGGAAGQVLGIAVSLINPRLRVGIRNARLGPEVCLMSIFNPVSPLHVEYLNTSLVAV